MPATVKHPSTNRLVIVSNRLPIVLKRDGEGRWRGEPGAGGLVTALTPVMRDRGGLWIGWPGIASDEGAVDLDPVLRDVARDTGYRFASVMLSAEEVSGYYHGFANEILWPLFHDLQTRCNFDPRYWRAYREVNRKFAREIVDRTDEDDHVWVHDYHLITVGRELAKAGVTSPRGFFLHIPFPPLDLFLKLPWRFQILNALLAYDLLGFQTQRDKRNFLHCVRSLRKDVKVRGRGRVATAAIDGRVVRIGDFPISIDFDEFASRAEGEDVARRVVEIKQDLGVRVNHRRILLGVDRLDYSKGIPERIKAFANALDRFAELRERVSLVQVVVPSRTHIPKYQDLRLDIERLVSKVNGLYTQTDWVPIHYIFRSVDRTELLSLYQAADIALITPLKDGMNLVAKEYCAANVSSDGVLILSEFAGAAAQLQRNVLLVNPYDYEEVAAAIAAACAMPQAEKRRRMQALRRTVRKSDIFWWVDSFLKAGFTSRQAALPTLEDYVPTDHRLTAAGRRPA